ncbi:hypothetical protein cyc_04177 [Cyclospora cayetanensis]|uniref:ADP-ribosylation factor-like protein 13B n=1 Tax=Cyclospora cayetanensis TaxID=88456 RepID=A0A1D3D5A1_9EIME|nr:hypothetical protein cyc_04177 [Cyclospora cayetanensis]
MFSLASGLLRWITQPQEVRVLLLGLERSGKTTLALQLSSSRKGQRGGSDSNGRVLPAVQPTKGFALYKVQQHHLQLLLWDLGGSQPFRCLWSAYVRDADLCLFVVDSADPCKLPEAAAALAGVLADVGAAASKQELKRSLPARVPVLVVCSKQDEPGAAQPEALLQRLPHGTGDSAAARSCSSGDAARAPQLPPSVPIAASTDLRPPDEQPEETPEHDPLEDSSQRQRRKQPLEQSPPTNDPQLRAKIQNEKIPAEATVQQQPGATSSSSNQSLATMSGLMRNTPEEDLATAALPRGILSRSPTNVRGVSWKVLYEPDDSGEFHRLLQRQSLAALHRTGSPQHGGVQGSHHGYFPSVEMKDSILSKNADKRAPLPPSRRAAAARRHAGGGEEGSH